MSAIDPNAGCYNQVIALNKDIGKKVKELNDRDWDFMMKQEQDRVDDRKATLNAIKAVGEAYGKGQPQTITYNTRGWW